MMELGRPKNHYYHYDGLLGPNSTIGSGYGPFG